MSIEISKSKFKAKALEIMKNIEETGEEVVITSYGKKMLLIKRYTDESVNPLLSLKDTIISFNEPFTPIDENDWELS